MLYLAFLSLGVYSQERHEPVLGFWDTVNEKHMAPGLEPRFPGLGSGCSLLLCDHCNPPHPSYAWKSELLSPAPLATLRFVARGPYPLFWAREQSRVTCTSGTLLWGRGET